MPATIHKLHKYADDGPVSVTEYHVAGDSVRIVTLIPMDRTHEKTVSRQEARADWTRRVTWCGWQK